MSGNKKAGLIKYPKSITTGPDRCKLLTIYSENDPFSAVSDQFFFDYPQDGNFVHFPYPSNKSVEIPYAFPKTVSMPHPNRPRVC